MGDDEDTNNAPRSRGDNNAAASDIGPAMVRGHLLLERDEVLLSLLIGSNLYDVGKYP